MIVLTFSMRLKSVNYKSHWNILVFYDQWKITLDLNMFHWKMSDFVSFPLFRFTLVIKLRTLDFESHWNALIYIDKKKRYAVRFKYVSWKDVWFCFFPIVWLRFSHKIKKFWFWKSLKYFSIDMLSDLNMSHGKMSDFVSFP